MAFSPMTIAIASHQRRNTLLRLLRSLDQQLSGSVELRRDLEVIVVLDGSTDGSAEAVAAHQWSVPVRVHAQPNRGPASARNVGLAAAAGRVVWFLDDDLVPSSDLVKRHRSAHRPDDPAVLVGPCRIPLTAAAPTGLVDWWNAFYEDLDGTTFIERFDRFTTANASAPAHLLSAVGGFNESFVSYGLEDYELGVRLLAEGTLLRFDKDALAWHPDIPPLSVQLARQRSLGRNAALLTQLHPETIDAVFPARGISAPRQVLLRPRFRNPRFLMVLSRSALIFARATSRVHAATSRRADRLSQTAAYAAGIAEGDPSGALLDRLWSSPHSRTG